MHTVAVKVDIVPLNWLNEILNLIPVLESINDEGLFTTPFIEALKDIAIMLNREAFNYFFLPFIAQLGVSVTYFSLYATSE